MTATKQFDPAAPIDFEEWCILRPFSYGDFMYGKNEHLPDDITGQDLGGLVKIGVLARINPDGTIERPTAQKPETPMGYLRYSDSLVLRLIREHPPSQEELQEIALLARRNRRGAILVEALDAMAGMPMIPLARGVAALQAGESSRLQTDLRAAVNTLEEERRECAALRSEYDRLQQAYAELAEAQKPPPVG